MEQNINHIVQIRYRLPDTHFFVFQNKKYPFKIDFFKLSSNFFSNQQTDQEVKTYQLIDEETELNLNLSDEIITTFIRYVQNEPISLNNENFVTLNYLAKKYEIDSLIEHTNEYISKYYSEIAIDILLIRQNDPKFETTIYEDCISNNFSKYVNNDRLFSLNLSILYRIIEKVMLNGEESKQINDELLDFLMSCLDKYGEGASILFKKVDFTKANSKYLKLLATKYVEKFDFHFINFSIVKMIVHQEEEICTKNDEIQTKNDEIKRQSDEIQTKNDEIKRQSDEIQIKNDEIKRQSDEIQTKNDEIKRQSDEIQTKNDEIKRQSDEIQIKNDEIKRQSDEI